MAQVNDIPDFMPKPSTVQLMAPDVECERFIRVSVKIRGGWRADETELAKSQCQVWLDKWNRQFKKEGAPDRTEADGWDLGIVVPGFANVTAQGPKLRPLELQDRTLISLQETVSKQAKQIDELLAALSKPAPKPQPDEDVNPFTRNIEYYFRGKAIEELTVPELRKLAESKGVELGSGWIKKEDLIELIQAAQ